MALGSKLAWELKDGDVILWRGDHYKLIDDPQVGRPAIGWTTLRTKSMQAGLHTVLMIEGDERINVVIARDYSKQIEQGRRRDARRVRAK